jgi:hypothetical protein
MLRYIPPFALALLMTGCGSTPSSATGSGSGNDGPPNDGADSSVEGMDGAAPPPGAAIDSGTSAPGEAGNPASDDAGRRPPVDAGPPPASTSSGTLNFHLLLGVPGSMPGDSITLTGDNYTDLIASNLIAGAMYAHLISKQTPTMQFDADYLYGSIFGQLLQENLATELYSDTSNLIDSSPLQQAVMAQGQGGPYQINNYAVDLIYGSYVPQGGSLINYVAVQKNIGYSFASAATQYTQPTPASFNDKYYGPMLTAYFHFNDYVALHKIGMVGDFTPPWEPQYDAALTTFAALPGNFLEVLLNVAYNQGYYGPLVTSYSKEGATATQATVATVNDYASVWGITDTYQQYPYQVRYYLDQLYDNPAPMTGVVPDNHVVFSVQALRGIFASCFETLAYVSSTTAYVYISEAQATAAFDVSTASQSVGATLDVSNQAERAQLFALLTRAIGTLESTLGTDFTATTLTAL